MSYEFIRNDKERTFNYAGKAFSKYGMLYTAHDSIKVMGEHFPPTKKGYQTFTTKYGITPSNFKKVHNSIMTQQWLDPVREYSKYLAFEGTNKKPNPKLLAKVHDLLPLLKQADKDGNKNIIPIIFLFGKPPKELKQRLGKSTWKKLCRNSFTKNLHIMKLYKRSPHMYHPVLSGFRVNISLESLSDFPSTVLKRGMNSPVHFDEGGLWACKQKVNLKQVGVPFGFAEGIYWDTKSMSKQVGKQFNPSWDYRKMHHKHEDFTRLINLKKYSTKPYEALKDIKVEDLSSDNYKATLLKSPFEVRTEGEVMKHCVGSYSDSVEKGSYLVYSITKGGKRSSTLGVKISTSQSDNCLTPSSVPKVEEKVTTYQFDQHYKQCNKRVECGEEKQLAQDIVNFLNMGIGHENKV